MGDDLRFEWPAGDGNDLDRGPLAGVFACGIAFEAREAHVEAATRQLRDVNRMLDAVDGDEVAHRLNSSAMSLQHGVEAARGWGPPRAGCGAKPPP